MVSSQSAAMSLYLSRNSTEYAGNMSCVTLQRQLHALCSNVSMAGTEECNKSEQGINLAVPITMTTFGVCGNILALLVLYSSRQEAQARRTVFFVMLSGLAWTDLTCQLAVSPIAIITYANKLKWVGGRPLCLYHGFMMVSFGMVMPLIICCMSLERLLAIKFSYCYTRRVTRRKALMTFLACWGVTLAFTVLPFIGVGSYELQYPGSWCFLNFHRESWLDAIYAGVFSSINILAILTMIVSNLAVAGTLCRMRLSRRLSNSPSLDRKLSLSGQFTPSSTTCAPGTVIRGKRHSDMEAQMIWFLGLITVAFSVCWLPLNVHILLMQFTGYTDCVLDLKVIRMASCNQILDPWLYVIFRKNSILRIVRRIRACFMPTKAPPRPAPAPHRPHYMVENRSYTVDGTTFGRPYGHQRICRHLILGGADLIGDSGSGNGFVGARLGGSNADVLCSQCSLSEDDDCSEMAGRDPLVHLRLGRSPTSSHAPEVHFSSDVSSKSDIEEEEDSTHETDLLSDRIKQDLLYEKSKSPEKKIDNPKSPLLKSKTDDASSGPKEKLRWFLPGLNSNGGDAFASYESTDATSFPTVRPPSIKSPHPIYKQKVHPSRSLLGQMTPGFSPADFCRGTSGTANQSAFTFPPPLSAHDISSQTPGGPAYFNTSDLEGAGSLSKSGSEGDGGDCRADPHTTQLASPALSRLTSTQNNRPTDSGYDLSPRLEGTLGDMPIIIANKESATFSGSSGTVHRRPEDAVRSAVNGNRKQFQMNDQDTISETAIKDKQNSATPQLSSPLSVSYRDNCHPPLRENIKNCGEFSKEHSSKQSSALSRPVYNSVSNSKISGKITSSVLRATPESRTNATKPYLSSKPDYCNNQTESVPYAKSFPFIPNKKIDSTSRTNNGSIPKSNGVKEDCKYTQV
ncbi:prostaglandin E2 receptor EP4 subtype [Elysia marginata]|uniref:Thromboxane A2 receptor n=1 Tax=Elysia marginata TaxID=1093978 RepID=A0AAV4GVJ5_9GAST|nr:prostaglandin E2 receptor EP4 subtype [Elysia marginata]